ncbi:MAG TPA: metalloregulator ArsR/SmtB family transcription factor [Patescibacteria group bacterium]|nr:metalloregulator ArsR/SmtB family transcription factor [Patescibacteria group bacterium]
MTDPTLKIFKALSDETRLQIVRDLMNGHSGVCPEIQKSISKSQPTLSHHIGKLVEADVLIESKTGVNCHYKVNTKFLKDQGIDIKKVIKID